MHIRPMQSDIMLYSNAIYSVPEIKIMVLYTFFKNTFMFDSVITQYYMTFIEILVYHQQMCVKNALKVEILILHFEIGGFFHRV